MKTQKLIGFFGVVVIFLFVQFNVFGQVHPHYLHALSNLRAARWQIEHRPGNWTQTVDEVDAVKRIDETINEIKKASIDDHKDINDHPMQAEVPDHIGRLHKAVDFLKDAKHEISMEEDNGFAQGLQGRAIKHIDEAIHLVEKAIKA